MVILLAVNRLSRFGLQGFTRRGVSAASPVNIASLKANVKMMSMRHDIVAALIFEAFHHTMASDFWI